MNIKKIILIFSALLFVIIFFLIFGKEKSNKNSSNNQNEIQQLNESLDANKFEKNIYDEIKTAFDKVEQDYQDAIKSYSKYKRSDFYNRQRLNEYMNHGEIDFVNLSDISLDNLFDLNGNKLNEYPKVNKELSDIYSFQEGNFILRTKSNESSYTFYYLITIGKNGLENYNLILYTANEVFVEDLSEIDDSDLLDVVGL